MGSPSPASPVTQTTQISQMDPRLYQWLYGTANSPGRQQIANAAMLGKTMQGVQNANPTALAAYYNVPRGTDLSQFQSHVGAMNPGQADPSLMKFPGQAVTPKQYYQEATAGESSGKKEPEATAAEGGEIEGYKKGARLARPAADVNTSGLNASQQKQWDKLEALRNSGNPMSQQQIKSYNDLQSARSSYAQANPSAASSKSDLSLHDAQVGVTPFFDPDPKTMRSTNPYYNKAIDVLQGMGQMPSEYGQASDIYNKAAQGLLGQTNYQPQQVSAQNISPERLTAAGYSAADMQAPEDIQALGYDAAQMQGAQMRGPQQWTSRTASQYMDPYAQSVIDQDIFESNRNFRQNLNTLRGGAARAGAFGGSRSTLQGTEALRNQGYTLEDIQNKGMSQAYNQALQQFNTAQGQGLQAGQANLQAALTTQQANQAAQNAQMQQYVQNALAAATTNYGGQLTAAQQNQIAQNAANQFNAQSQNQIGLANQQTNLAAQQANQQANLNAGIQNQQAGLTAQGLNLQAYNQAGNMGQGLLGVGQGIGAYNQNLLQNWGAAGNTLQNLAQGYYDKRQQSAQNLWGGVNTATQPATGTLLGSPWGTSMQGNYTTQRKKGGKLSIKV